jgi:hypothetical protein
MHHFSSRDVHSWPEFAAIVSEHNDGWLYRGQRQDWGLKSSLERAIDDWGLEQRIGPEVEMQLLRAFRRIYRGDDLGRAEVDTLYCLALMQHHGAPTRLLDWSYSPFVAAKFAIESGGRGAVIWCLNRQWCYTSASTIVGDAAIRERDTDTSRNDSTFKSLYGIKARRRKFAFLENPVHLIPRLSVQQGVFLCPGDIGVSFAENLGAMSGFDIEGSIVKLRLMMESTTTHEFARTLRRMNITSAALFPGLDGLARSLGEGLFLYASLAKVRTGSAEHERPL